VSARTLFVTATDTGAGKTLAACGLLHALRTAGHRACGFKPVAAGGMETPRGLRNEDALALQEAGATDEPYELINPCLLREPAAPHLAAEMEGRRIRRADLDVAQRELASRHEVIVAEGAGGWQVPLDEVWTLGSWVAERDWPVILVVGMRLGCLNHALLSAESITRRAKLAGWIANVLPPQMPLLEGNIETLRRRFAAPLLGVIPPGADAAAAGRALDLAPLDRFLRPPPDPGPDADAE
jgi:dethiobiotin synthetase